MSYIKLYEDYSPQKDKLKQLFNNLSEIIQINYFKYGDNYVNFTYRKKYNAWSHSLKLMEENDKFYLLTYRIPNDTINKDKSVDMSKYKFKEFNLDAIYKIPIENTDLVEKVLFQYDRFKKIGNFNKLLYGTGIKSQKETEQEDETKTKTGASVKANGSLTLARNFGKRKKYVCSEEELNNIMNLPTHQISDILDIDNPEKHKWYEIGDTKYSRFMYDPINKIKREQTMGEFYGDSIVD